MTVYIITACLWAGYAVWEILVQRWARGIVGAPIRVDLFIIAPLLLIFTIWSVILLIKRRKS